MGENMELNKIHTGDCVDVMKTFPDECVDMTLTSPPYDNLRSYKGYNFNFESIAKELYRITKVGGVVVWVVGDATIKGSETGTSFKQALFFKECGFNLHDTMIWNKGTFTAVGSMKVRYAPVFEYMFIFKKGKLKTFNPIRDRPNKYNGLDFRSKRITNRDGISSPVANTHHVIPDFGQRFNIWEVPQCRKKDIKHPARFPEKLAHDHIISWSNKGDIVLDPMCGSGTTLKMAKETGRNYIGIEVSSEYVGIAEKRVSIAKITHRTALQITDRKENYDPEIEDWPYSDEFDYVGEVVLSKET